MTEQRKKILQTYKALKPLMPKGFRPRIALITEQYYSLPAEFKTVSSVKLEKLPFYDSLDFKELLGNILFVKLGGRDIIVLKGRMHYYDGFSMRDIAHIIYVFRYLGIEKILSIDEVGHLNPRLKCGEFTLIYDHINLTGDNPLIGENDDELGIRFPDMSNAYDEQLFLKLNSVLLNNKMKISESVYLCTIGPESETEAEARFYREIGSDVVGYSIVPENITAVHARLKFAAVSLITRNLVPDKIREDDSSEEEKLKEMLNFRKESVKLLNSVLPKLVKNM